MNRSTIIHDTPAPAPDSWPHSRAELIAVLVLCLIAAALRFAFPSRMAVEHFDEGVYASNLWCPDDRYRYPDRHLYAPSLVSALIEWSIILFGDKGIAPLLPSLVFGTLTIPLLWWVGRQWFGPLAGIAAATLLGLSDFHIAFSRSALTDVPLCFWLLLAIYLFERAFRELSWLTAIAAGITTGVAWWTKYNGWLPLAISLSGLIAWSLFARRDERHFLRHLALWSVAALTALLVWSPYWLSLPNGYAEVARNHSQYVVGFAGWRIDLIRQREALAAFNSPWSWGTLAIVIVIAAILPLMCVPKSKTASNLLVGRSVWSVGTDLLQSLLTAAFFAIFAIARTANCLLIEIAVLGLFLGIMFTVFLWIKRWQHPDAEFTITNSGLAFTANPNAAQTVNYLFQRKDWLLAAWVIGLIVSIPLYRPYPRLALPCLTGTLLCVVGIVHSFSRWLQGIPSCVETRPLTSDARFRFRTVSAVMWALMAAFVFWFPIPADSFRFRCWETRSQFREIARDVTRDALRIAQAGNQKPIQNTQAVLYVYAEPGLFFHLPSDGLAVQPAGNLDFVDIEATRKLPTFLITGPHAHRSRAFADEFAKRAEQFALIASYPYDASDFVRLDDVSATQLRARRDPLEVQLFRVK